MWPRRKVELAYRRALRLSFKLTLSADIVVIIENVEISTQHSSHDASR